VASLGHVPALSTFLPAGESEWEMATASGPLTTGDRFQADGRSDRTSLRAGSGSTSRLTDCAVPMQRTQGTITVRVRRLHADDTVEVDTPNQTFSIHQPGSYRVEASEDGAYALVTVPVGEGQRPAPVEVEPVPNAPVLAGQRRVHVPAHRAIRGPVKQYAPGEEPSVPQQVLTSAIGWTALVRGVSLRGSGEHTSRSLPPTLRPGSSAGRGARDGDR
jgi:hypothetical protein